MYVSSVIIGDMEKRIAVDLCHGMGGWTVALLETGWMVYGYDIRRFSEYPAQSIIQDVRTVSGLNWRGKVSLILASPPCEEFSRHDQPWTRAKNPPAPELGIQLFRACERIIREAGCPGIIENVRGAQKFVGKAATHWGAYYLWGNVPALLIPYIKKDWKMKRENVGPRCDRSAIRAKIPSPLADFIARSY